MIGCGCGLISHGLLEQSVISYRSKNPDSSRPFTLAEETIFPSTRNSLFYFITRILHIKEIARLKRLGWVVGFSGSIRYPHPLLFHLILSRRNTTIHPTVRHRGASPSSHKNWLQGFKSSRDWREDEAPVSRRLCHYYFYLALPIPLLRTQPGMMMRRQEWVRGCLWILQYKLYRILIVSCLKSDIWFVLLVWSVGFCCVVWFCWEIRVQVGVKEWKGKVENSADDGMMCKYKSSFRYTN